MDKVIDVITGGLTTTKVDESQVILVSDWSRHDHVTRILAPDWTIGLRSDGRMGWWASSTLSPEASSSSSPSLCSPRSS